MYTHDREDQHAIVGSPEEIHWYLQDLAMMPTLTPNAEQELVQQIAADPHSREADDARTALIEANLHGVVRLARRYQPFGLELADLVQEGNLALIKAAQQFDPQRNPHFRFFATQRVYWALYNVVKAYLHERHLLQPDMEPLYPLREQVLKALAHNAIDEQAVIFDLPEARFVSLNDLLEEEDTHEGFPDERSSAHPSLIDETLVDEMYLVQELGTCIAESLQTLTERERIVLTQRYLQGISMSLESVGRMLKVSRERVRQFEERGLRKMRHPRISHTLL